MQSSRLAERLDHSLAVVVAYSGTDRVTERRDIGEGLMCEVVRLEIVPDDLDVIEFGGVFGQPLNGDPVCPQTASTARERLLKWIGPLSSTSTTGLTRWPSMGPWRCSRCAAKSLLRFVRLVWTISWRVM